MASVNRRRFLKAAGAAGAGAAATAVARPGHRPVVARDQMAHAGELAQVARYALWRRRAVRQVRRRRRPTASSRSGPSPADERIPALEVTDAVSSGTVEACHTAPYYMWAKDPTFAFGCAVPFGLNGRMQNAWWLEGGGEALMNAFYAKYNIYGLLAGNTMAQMGGWFRKEINTIDDLKGVKMRIGGFAAAVISKLGVVPQQLAGGDIYQALEKGTIDAAEWVGPHDDEKLGLHKVAKFYYYPGWWEGGAMIHVQVNKAKWEALPKSYQAILKAAAAQAHNYMVGRYDALNPVALKKIARQPARSCGRSRRRSSMPASRPPTRSMPTSAPRTRTSRSIWESVKAFRADQYLWLQLADNTYDNYMMIQQRKKTL